MISTTNPISNVDSYKVHVSGDVYVRRHGKEHRTREYGSGISLARGSRVRITPNTPHGAHVGPRDRSFHSVQMWMNGVVPTSIAKRPGEGEEVLGPGHPQQITTREAAGEGTADLSAFAHIAHGARETAE